MENWKKEPRTVDQQLCDDWLDKETESSQPQKTKKENPNVTNNENFFADNFAKKTQPLTESAILSGLDENYVPKDFISQSMHWATQHPLETILGTLVIGGIGYKLYQHFTKKAAPETEEALQNSFLRARRKRIKERKRTFMEKANDLFHSENEQGERTFDLKKTITAVSVAATGTLAGVIASKKSLPITLMGATSVAIAGYGLNSPLLTLGAIGLAVGAFVSELVRMTVKKDIALEGMDSDIPELTKKELSITEEKIEKRISAETLVNELNAIEEVQRNEKEQKLNNKEDFLEFDKLMKVLEQEELLELA